MKEYKVRAINKFLDEIKNDFETVEEMVAYANKCAENECHGIIVQTPEIKAEDEHPMRQWMQWDWSI